MAGNCPPITIATIKNEPFFLAGICKYGSSCMYDHRLPLPLLNFSLHFNALGFPKRWGKPDCYFYMRTGVCGYGTACRFHHPEPVLYYPYQGYGPYVGGEAVQYQNGYTRIDNGWNQRVTFISIKEPAVPLSDIGLPLRPADHRQAMVDNMHPMYSHNPCKFFLAGICKRGSSCMYDHRLPQPALNFSLHFNALGFPKRWGKPDCYFYMRTGVCGYGTACRFHHPEPVLYYPYHGYGPYVGGEAVQYQNGYTRIDNGWNQRVTFISIREPEITLNDIGLPLRPEKNLCRNYEGTGRCRYGRGCKFNHPMKQP
ncbi:zinc finger CCCH domain-containing protein 37-like [Bidens hawaiensis]|uniref:zinc finger CCCH domain-containing protein 37-like n=1 Tax=Bidens hawaiensis TaxID=980011 RepID=UPI00404B727A